MSKRILDVGNCAPDHASISGFFTKNFNAQVDLTDKADDTLAALRSTKYDLVVINRKLDIDYTDGLEIIKQIKADQEVSATPVMLVTNFADHQDAAIAAGALCGFGKLELEDPAVIERVSQSLGVAKTG